MSSMRTTDWDTLMAALEFGSAVDRTAALASLLGVANAGTSTAEELLLSHQKDVARHGGRDGLAGRNGSAQWTDLTGAVIGRLTVVGYLGTLSSRPACTASWLCRCSCGAFVARKTKTLKRSPIKMCGGCWSTKS